MEKGKNEKNNDEIAEDGKQITRNGVESRTVYELNHLWLAVEGGQHKATCIDNGRKTAERAKRRKEKIAVLTYRWNNKIRIITS